MWQYDDKPIHGIILFNSVMMLFLMVTQDVSYFDIRHAKSEVQGLFYDVQKTISETLSYGICLAFFRSFLFEGSYYIFVCLNDW